MGDAGLIIAEGLVAATRLVVELTRMNREFAATGTVDPRAMALSKAAREAAVAAFLDEKQDDPPPPPPEAGG